MAEIECKLTKQKGKPVRAHIIPESFYGHICPKNPPLVISSNDEKFPKRSRTGIFDEGLVIWEGEQYFNVPDDYAFKVLIERKKEYLDLVVEKTKVGVALLEYDYKKLKMFFLTLLWRASETSRNEFSGVRLGSHSDVIRKMILNDDPGLAEDYSVIIFRFTDAAALQKGSTLFPYKEKHDGIHYYRFFLNEYCALIKVDKRKTTAPFNLMQMKPAEQLEIFDRSFANSPESKAIREILLLNNKKLPDWFIEASKINA